ncbi:MAG: bifunctional glutamate N-acetyltransferase/amino-acid acetyltransferase ArgJ [Acidobacteria bacterium]|nr:MAG: bifunctional glutamate N-acetyltransferase/amino-acid acetyltransferase ArgJ [Acidobacteriota bacterium]
MPSWNTVEGSLATPKGFRAAAAAAGVKKAPGALDLALIVCDVPGASAAGVFTTNRAAAAPVLLCRQNLKGNRGRGRAIIANSGNANACTGRAGLAVAEQTAEAVARMLRVRPCEVFVSSTGVIGTPLNVDLILQQLPTLNEVLSVECAPEVARAIMTTDRFPKSAVLQSKIGGKTVTLAGVAKGAGMIHPNMATMLSYVTTDAAVAPAALQKMLRIAVNASFNRITVDGDTSTNDSVVALASGQSGAAIRPGTPAAKKFLQGLTELCQMLAQMIVKDGEGATKIARIEVRGAGSTYDAERVVRAVANSPLVKTALAGGDPNWGRVVCAAGYSGAAIDASKVDVRVNGLYLCRRGVHAGFDEAAAKKELDNSELVIRIDLHQGKADAWVWTCDFTNEYIRINASRS